MEPMCHGPGVKGETPPRAQNLLFYSILVRVAGPDEKEPDHLDVVLSWKEEVRRKFE